MKFVILFLNTILAVLLLFILGKSSIITGFAWGTIIALTQTLLASRFFEKNTASTYAENFKSYLSGALLRIPLLMGLFLFVVFIIGIKQPPASWGLLIGIGVGFGVSGVLTFKKNVNFTANLHRKSI